MRLLTRYLLLLLFLVAWAGAVRAQSVCADNPQPAKTFIAVDNRTNQELTSFCVGQPVRFRRDPSRGIIDTTQIYYGVKLGTGPAAADYPPNCVPPNKLPYVYTPTRNDVGIVTVAEFANKPNAPPGSRGETYFIRTYKVYDNAAPAFTVAPCPSGNVLVTLTSPISPLYDRYTATAGGRTVTLTPTNPSAPVEVSGGATTVTVMGYYSDPDACASLPGTATIPPLLPAQIPRFTTLTLHGEVPGGAATLAVDQLPAGYNYALQRADPSTPSVFVTVAHIPAGSTSFPLRSALPGCYRVQRTDTCQVLPPAFSETICTLNLTGSSALNHNQLLFNDFTPAPVVATSYTVTRDGKEYLGTTRVLSGLEDADVQCGTTYPYVVTATYSNGTKSVSNPVAIPTKSNLPPPTPQLLASFNLRNVVVLTPQLVNDELPAGSTLYYSRSAGKAAPVDYFGPATNLRPPRDSTKLDDLRKEPPCYSVRTMNVCRIISAESATACPSLLTAGAADANGTSAALSWTAFAGPDPNVPASYVLQPLGPDYQVLGNIPVSGSSYTDLTPSITQQVLRYRLQISGAGLPAGTFSYSNVATVTRQLLLTIPTAFTPNGDGLNDVLEVKGKYLKDYTFVVVDRNGQEVFRGSERADVWDGRIKGHAPVLGTYAWRFQQNNEDGTPFTAMGSVTILK